MTVIEETASAVIPPRPLPEVTREEPRKLFLAPHNDDETLFGAFTLLRHDPDVVICLRSFRMSDPKYPGGPCPVDAAGREAETVEAMQVLGVSRLRFWPYRDDRPDWASMKRDLQSWLEPTSPWTYDRVFAPAVEQRGNLHHSMIGTMAMEVFGDIVTPYLTYTTDGRSTHGAPVPYEPEWVALKHRALACYRSQCEHPATRRQFTAGLEEYYEPRRCTMSIVDQGHAELDQREKERVEREQHEVEQNRRTTAWWFRFVFIGRPGAEVELEDWHTIGGGDTYAPSEFVVEGVRYRVRWKFEGTGGDRAHWDNGWWPDWTVVVRRPRRWFPLLSHDVEIPVWGAAQVAEAVSS